MKTFKNPFRPGAGQQPPYLAGRETEKEDFIGLLDQAPISKNLILTGLRGVGKTVLLETLKPIALQKGWFWAGTDLSESTSVSEHSLATRILADISTLASSFVVSEQEKKSIGFKPVTQKVKIKLDYPLLVNIYKQTPGLSADQLKKVLEVVWDTVKPKVKGIVLAYDEAQNLKDKSVDKSQYPLSLLLEVIQYLQRKEIPYLLILTGLPTLFPNLVETRTYAERMFHIITIDKLDESESKEAILKPINDPAAKCPIRFTDHLTKEIVKFCGGYPYFIQFFCKELFDIYLQQLAVGIKSPVVNLDGIITKMDTDFYSGRWNKITDRQRDLLKIVAELPSANEEFTIQDIALKAGQFKEEAFKPSYINQMLNKLIDAGLIYKNRHGKYSFAVPMLANYIKRQTQNGEAII